ncbi:unnamed protein product [Blepharisma stoltei]|uniref:Secreted protein n=1 Tax=Blepharisma stoltei TaxID=1481888 RepID=A0AAU9IHQ6_9CILI|nr:unnamed protein product [Blepharisma stoltei]
MSITYIITFNLFLLVNSAISFLKDHKKSLKPHSIYSRPYISFQKQPISLFIKNVFAKLNHFYLFLKYNSSCY